MSARPSVRHLVGRDQQVALVEEHLDDLARAHGSLLVLTGEPGIGKTRLAEEIVDLARARGATTAWATSWQGEGAPPLWPWVQILRQLTGSSGTLEQFLPTLPSKTPAARFAQFVAVVDMIREATARAPLVLVVDDAQWADGASIELLSFVASSIRDAACLLVATYRPDEISRDHLAELARVGVTLAVPRLSAEAASELLHASVGTEVPAAVAEVIAARSDGNPLFVWEFGQLMAESGRLDVAPAAVPVAVAAVIERRLARLPEPATAVLRVAALAGKVSSVDAVARIGGFTGEETVAGLGAAAGLGLVVWTEPATGVGFSHDVVRDVVLDAFDPAVKAELHLRAAGVFDERSSTDASFHAVVADHFDRAGPAHRATASRHWERAARRAERLLAYEEAAGSFGRAARSGADEPRRHAELLIAQGECLLLAGDLGAARVRFRHAAAEARAIEEAELMARAALGVGTGPIAWEVPIHDAEYEALIGQALALLPADAIGLRSALLSRLSVAAASPETMGLARRRAQDAIELAERVGDPSLTAQALAALNDAISGPAHTIERRGNADTIVELALAAGDPALELLGYRFRIVADLEVGDLAAVDRDIAAFTRVAVELRQPLVSWYVPLFQGMRAHLRGDLDAAERAQAEVAAAAEATGSTNAALLAATLGMVIAAARGHRVDPALLAGLVDVDPADWASYASGQAVAHWFGGDPDGARDLLALHARNHFGRLGDDSEHLTTLILFAIVAVGVSDREAMQDLYGLLLPHSGLWAVDGIAACSWGPVELALARLAVALDRGDDGRDHLDRAKAAVDRADAPVFLPTIGELEAQLDASQPTAPVVDDGASDAATNVFSKEGQFWTLTFRDETVRLRDAKGLGDLARLLAMPGRGVHVLDLAGATIAAAPHGRPSRSDLGEVLDARARGEYRRRLGELEDELADAEACADLARAERARAERDFLAAELAGALGLDGRPRRSGDPVERARKAVTGRIRLAIGRIDGEHPALARHLSAAVHTGTYCVYEPEVATEWAI